MNDNQNHLEVANNHFEMLANIFGVIFNVLSHCFWKLGDYIKSIVRKTDEQKNDNIVSGKQFSHHEETNSTGIENDTDKVAASEEIQSTITNTQSGRNEGFCDVQSETQFTSEKSQSANYTGVIKKIKRNSADSTGLAFSIESFTNVTTRFHDQPYLQEITNEIIEGFKVMIIMRGVPGCGKSYLAKEIIDATTCDEYTNHIFSSDNFFYDQNGRYNFDVHHLRDAHNWNKNQVNWYAFQGWSPIIVDNTNIKAWEMEHYFNIAVSYGYLVKIVEPQAPWSKSTDELAIMNRHNVPKETIERMMFNYESITVELAMERFKLEYTMEMPQHRVNPPLYKGTPRKSKERDQFQKACRKVNKQITSVSPFLSKLRKHRNNCENENQSFAQIRQIYPSVSQQVLWKLFEYCKGNGDWTMDILLNDKWQSVYYKNSDNAVNTAIDFDCDCELHELKNSTINAKTHNTMDETFEIGDEHYSQPNDLNFSAFAIDSVQNEDEFLDFHQRSDLVCQSDSDSSSEKRHLHMCELPKSQKNDVFEVEFAWSSNKAKVADWIWNIPQDLNLQIDDNVVSELFPNEEDIVNNNKFDEAVNALKYHECSEEPGTEVGTIATNDFQLFRTTSERSDEKLAPEEVYRSNLK